MVPLALVAGLLPRSIVRLWIAGSLALAIPAFALAQGESGAAPSVIGPSAAAGAERGLLDSLAKAGVASSVGVATPMAAARRSCASSSYQRGNSAASERFLSAPFGGEGAVGSGNSSTPAFSSIIVADGQGGIGIEYLSPNRSPSDSNQPNADIYRFDGTGLHRTECNVPSGGAR